MDGFGALKAMLKLTHPTLTNKRPTSIATWNLMCRATNTCTIHLHHMDWQNDCLCIYFAHMKNDQGGDSKRDPRHVYLNPLDLPWVQ